MAATHSSRSGDSGPGTPSLGQWPAKGVRKIVRAERVRRVHQPDDHRERHRNNGSATRRDVQLAGSIGGRRG